MTRKRKRVQTESLKIVHVLRAPIGGLFRHVVDLATAQVALGHQVGLFFDSRARDARVDAALSRVTGGFALGVEGAAIARNPGLNDVFAFARFRAFLSRVKPDVIHGHGAKGGFYARFARWTLPQGAPIVAYTPHGGSFNHHIGRPIHRFYMAVERMLGPATDLYLFESAYIGAACKRYIGAGAGLRRVVCNGLNDKEFELLQTDADAADLVYVGELRAAKGVDTLIDALPRMKPRNGRPPRLVLVGSGPAEAEFRAQAERLGVLSSIEFLGPRSAREAFRRGRVFVAPSRQESLPYVVLEAAAAAVPIVATDVGGVPEIFGPYRDRLGPCNDVADLTRRLDAALDADPRAQGDEAKALREYVRTHFSLGGMRDAVLAGYRDALQRRRAPPLVLPLPKRS